MRRIDELHLEHPFAGARMLRDMLRLESHQIGRKHISTLMKKLIFTGYSISAAIPGCSTCPASSISIAR
jgi:hypothetical protein